MIKLISWWSPVGNFSGVHLANKVNNNWLSESINEIEKTLGNIIVILSVIDVHEDDYGNMLEYMNKK